MRIKRIELNGFKSFMEPTALEFPAGITAVVGPNGCGKSNIVDAIRWVLGEQSPKHLRGEAMEDVVFAGNGEIAPVGMAEVSLLMERDESDLVPGAAGADGGDEDGGVLPQLAHASEVMVTRRYFRSGESEYYINRALCRLKDITELFLGTGVGTKAYAIIEQGRIEQLVNAKPEELRSFIEEAAGVTRFRQRRLAAERKMERTRDNLLRVQDVLRELERQKASLERQARRAEEYHRIKDELRELDVRVMARKGRAWGEEVDALRARVATLDRELAAVQEEIHGLSAATLEARARRVANEERLQAIEAELTDQRLRAGEAQSRAAAQRQRQRELEERVVQARHEAEALRVRLTALEGAADRLRLEAERLLAEHEQARVAHAAAEEELRGLAAAMHPLEQELEAAKDVLLDALAEDVRVRNLSEAVRRRQDELEDRRRRLDEEQRLLGERLQANALASEGVRSKMVAGDDGRKRLEHERQALAVQRAEAAEREEALRSRLDVARAESTRIGSRLDSLRELQARYEGCARGVSSLLGRPTTGARVLAGVLRVPDALERAVAAALGPRLGEVVVLDVEEALRAVRWLAESNGGRAAVVPRVTDRRPTVIVPAGRRLLDEIDVDAQHWALAEALLGGVLLADDLDAAFAVWGNALHPVTVVTLAGESIDASGTVTGGSEPPLEETLLARERELRELERLLAENAARVADVDHALQQARATGTALDDALAEVGRRLQAIGLEQLSLEKDRERLEEERCRITAELEAGALEATGLAGTGGEVTAELSALQQRSVRAERAVVERREELAARQAALAAWRERYAAGEQRRTTAAVHAAAVAERSRALQGEEQQARAGIEELTGRFQEAERAERAAGDGTRLAATEVTEADGVRAAAEVRIEVLALERRELRAAIQQADSTLTADDVRERQARERFDTLRDERSRLEGELTERRIGLEHLATQLAERYELTLATLGEVSLEEGGGDDEAARVEMLRARLGQLGDVNPGALHELEEVRGRHEFLVAQRADLEQSLDDLRRTIARLVRTSRQRFDETFAAANERLAEVFPKLFPDGKARLELITPEGAGEAGVEIVVQPFGKKLQSLSLLSGGEKALTATALVLSLFLIRPTPFCLLDEVDAPLDEANIGRFNQIVREMAERTQFVLITHNRRTMEAADTLYGITMERPGVSKVVSVRLREAA